MEEQEGKEKFKEQTRKYHPSTWERPQGRYRRGEQNIGQPAEGARSRRKGAIFINTKNSSTKGRNLTLY